MVQREGAAELRRQRDMIIAGLYANSNFTGDQGGTDRADNIKSLERHFNKAITVIYYPRAFKEKDVDWDNPFWSAAKRSRERLTKLMQSLEGTAPQTTMEEATGMSKEQMEARTNSRRSIDQI